MYKKCQSCGISFSGQSYSGPNDKILCDNCYYEYIAYLQSKVIVTSSHNIEGYSIIQYISFESVEMIVGTGLFSEIDAAISDVLGAQASGYESKLTDLKKTLMNKIVYIAIKKNANGDR